jgi:hypothetical protein
MPKAKAQAIPDSSSASPPAQADVVLETALMRVEFSGDTGKSLLLYFST